MTQSIHSAYLGLVDPITERARFICELEGLNLAQKRENDIEEAMGVVRLFLGGLRLSLQSLTSGDFEKFDAVVGDHNCHVSARVALAAANELAFEVEALMPQVKKQVSITSKGPRSPAKLIEDSKALPPVSERMKYLVCAAILRSGTECIEHPDGTMTLTINAGQIAGKSKCSLEIVGRMITPLREYVNRGSIAYVQELAVRILQCSYLERVEVVATCREENYQFVSAFYNMKATLMSLAADGIHFLVVPYTRNKVVQGEFYLFDPSGMRMEAKDVNPDTPIFVIQGFGSLDAVEKVGLFRFILASIATCPQFEGREEQLNEEVAEHREAGRKLPSQFRICHTYADTLKRVKKC